MCCAEPTGIVAPLLPHPCSYSTSCRYAVCCSCTTRRHSMQHHPLGKHLLSHTSSACLWYQWLTPHPSCCRWLVYVGGCGGGAAVAGWRQQPARAGALPRPPPLRHVGTAGGGGGGGVGPGPACCQDTLPGVWVGGGGGGSPHPPTKLCLPCLHTVCQSVEGQEVHHTDEDEHGVVAFHAAGGWVSHCAPLCQACARDQPPPAVPNTHTP
jgi:hypothetical protein